MIVDDFDILRTGILRQSSRKAFRDLAAFKDGFGKFAPEALDAATKCAQPMRLSALL
jgi:hypothetical protein